MVRRQCHALEMALEEVTIIIRQLLRGAVGVEVVAHRRNDERLDFGRRDAADGSPDRLRLSLQHGPRDVVAVAGTALV